MLVSSSQSSAHSAEEEIQLRRSLRGRCVGLLPDALVHGKIGAIEDAANFSAAPVLVLDKPGGLEHSN